MSGVGGEWGAPGVVSGMKSRGRGSCSRGGCGRGGCGQGGTGVGLVRRLEARKLNLTLRGIKE